jgi:hypothetical protein
MSKKTKNKKTSATKRGPDYTKRLGALAQKLIAKPMTAAQIVGAYHLTGKNPTLAAKRMVYKIKALKGEDGKKIGYKVKAEKGEKTSKGPGRRPYLFAVTAPGSTASVAA